MTLDLRARQEVGVCRAAVGEYDRRAPVEARMSLEPVERVERICVDLVHLAVDRVRAAVDHRGERAEVVQREARLRARLRDELRAREDAVVPLPASSEP